ncbi:hypothetical protein DFH08DRAFT_944951 [Mycena albidolilacea]|uniref:Protein kinase domain-containing protein n=1 Tax=Mycena albidolilacea TaxID=1033008 RepID=A0AAD6Z3M0_9AGAR|nr:hypothetical protein DFH08DRAFT_944951 [Mycena albidolilacea]
MTAENICPANGREKRVGTSCRAEEHQKLSFHPSTEKPAGHQRERSVPPLGWNFRSVGPPAVCSTAALQGKLMVVIAEQFEDPGRDQPDYEWRKYVTSALLRPVSMSLPPLDSITGAPLIGTWASSLLYTAELLQFVYYFRKFKDDDFKLKTLVTVVFVIDTVSALADYTFVYLCTITHAGDLAYLSKADWALPLYAICTGCVAVLFQSFLTFRYWRFTKNTIVVVSFSMLILVTFGGAFASGLEVMLFPTFKDREKVRVAGMVWVIAQVSADIIIAGALVYEFQKAKSKFSKDRRRIRNTLNRLVVLTIQTGSATAVIASATLITFLINVETNISGSHLPIFSAVPTGIMYSLGRIYVLCMLLNLNIRTSTNEESSQATSRIAGSGRDLETIAFGHGAGTSHRDGLGGVRAYRQSAGFEWNIPEQPRVAQKMAPFFPAENVGKSVVVEQIIGHDLDLEHPIYRAHNRWVRTRKGVSRRFRLASIISSVSAIQFTDSSTPTQGGTVRYQSPELQQGGDNTQSSDIYGFGRVVYELLTGTAPFPELRTDAAVAIAVLQGRRPPRPTSCLGTPALEGLWNLLQDCWDQSPEKRPTASQVVERLMGDDIRTTKVESLSDWDDTFTSRFRRHFLGPQPLPSVKEFKRMIFGDEYDIDLSESTSQEAQLEVPDSDRSVLSESMLALDKEG